MAKEKIEKQINIRNKRASFEYFFLETYTAGIMLMGTEIKSIRQGKVNLEIQRRNALQPRPTSRPQAFVD